MSKKLNKFIEEAVENIRRDRETTQELLSDLINIAGQSEHNHKEVSLAAAKYLTKRRQGGIMNGEICTTY